jgi:hypothetical protein
VVILYSPSINVQLFNLCVLKIDLKKIIIRLLLKHMSL